MKLKGKFNEAPRPYGRGIFSLLLRRERNPSCRRQSLWRRSTEAETSSHSSTGLRPRFSAKWDKKSAIIVLHEATTGPGHDLRDYLLKEGIYELLFISHPLTFVREKFRDSSRYEYYKKGKLIKKKSSLHWVMPEPLLYFKDFIYTVIWSFKIKRKVDYFFGLGNLNAFAGLTLRFFGKAEKVIYYVIDYIPNRFSNELLNSLYHRIEKISALYSNLTWNLSPVMIEEREKKWRTNFPNQLVVMHGVHFSRIKRLPFNKINKNEILYMGGLIKKQGIQIVIEALPLILRKIKDIKFTIIGSGEYENQLRRFVIKLKLEDRVEFLGYIPDHTEVENRMAKATLALAMYEEKKDNFTYYTDPGKVKNYLGAGLPVIITDVPYIAKVIEKAGCGLIVSYKKEELAEKVIKLLSDKQKIKKYRANAVKFAKKYDWNKIFAEASEKI